MPRRPPPRCSTPRCPHFKPCPVHKRPSPPRSLTTSARGYDVEHQRTAALVLQHQPWCTWCSARSDLCADHIYPGQPERGYQTLCRSCNTRKMLNERAGRVLTVLAGIPGAGKSTWAQLNANAQWLTSDGTRLAGHDPMDVMAALVDTAAARLRAGQDVTIDACSTQERWRTVWLQLAPRMGARARLVVMHCSLEQAIARQQHRPAHQRVDPRVIRRYHAEFEAMLAVLPDEGWDEIIHHGQRSS